MDTNLQTIIDQARACKNCEEFNIIYFKAFSQKSVQLIRDLLPIGIEIDAFTWRDIPKITNTIALAKDAPEFVNALLNELIFPESMEDLLIWSVNSNEE
ncbi:MAG: hypothetical protein NT000_01820, partial [Proteobacteria bacterium]|nr:hypothetical protein [Pseudomonadota bacterium]